MSKKVHFFKQAIKNYQTSGTLVPSSRFLANRMLNAIDFSKAEVIVELGSGNGVITKSILEKIQPQTTLICFEINAVFFEELQEMEKQYPKQLIVLKKSAENVVNELQKLGFNQADYIISSLPLAIIPKKISHKILTNSYFLLKKYGVFIQYQYSLAHFNKLKKIFGLNIVLDFEILNFPPAFVYKCVKK